jgi:hypothetical protein
MFQFLFGVAMGAAGYWAWQSFGRDLLGMGGDQGESTYGGFSSSTGTTGYSGTTTDTTSPTGAAGTSPGTTGYPGGSTTGSGT